MQPHFGRQPWKAIGVKTGFHCIGIHPYIGASSAVENDISGNGNPDYFWQGQRVLVPLCGQDHALIWFRDRAAHVTGVDQSAEAIEAFFEAHDLDYTLTTDGRYDADGITLLNRNIFSIQPDDVGKVDFVYDREALISLPLAWHRQYRAKLDELMHPGSKCLLVTFEFKPSWGDTPLSSLPPADVHRYYGDRYIVDHVVNAALPNHQMVKEFDLDFLKEHSFILTKTEAKQENTMIYFWPLAERRRL